MKAGFAAATLALIGVPSFAHRLDEYLQNTIVSVEKHRLEAQMILTPGVAVFPILIPEIDTDRNGVISEAEQRTYASRVLRDLSLAIDGHRLTPELLRTKFPSIEEMKEGQGEIQLDFEADLPYGARDRKITLENHHQSRISAYQVNCLVPRDPNIQIARQIRNYSQSLYQLEYVQTDVPSFWGLVWLSPIALLLFTRLVICVSGRNGSRG